MERPDLSGKLFEGYVWLAAVFYSGKVAVQRFINLENRQGFTMEDTDWLSKIGIDSERLASEADHLGSKNQAQELDT